MRLAYKVKRALEDAVKAAGTVADGRFVYGDGKSDPAVAAAFNAEHPGSTIDKRDVARIRVNMFGKLRPAPAPKPIADGDLVTELLGKVIDLEGRVAKLEGRPVSLPQAGSFS